MTFSDGMADARSGCVEAGFVMDEDAFRGFYDRNARGVWAYLFRVTGDRQMADDLLQEAFYRFLRAASALPAGRGPSGGAPADGERYQSDAHRRNSLYRIATNLARDARRSGLFRQTPAVSGDDVERLADVRGGAGNHGADTDRRTDVTRAMSRLRPRDREMLWLAYAEGASHDEIAGVIGVRASSMKLLLYRARRRMAALLTAGGGK